MANCLTHLQLWRWGPDFHYCQEKTQGKL